MVTEYVGKPYDLTFYENGGMSGSGRALEWFAKHYRHAETDADNARTTAAEDLIYIRRLESEVKSARALLELMGVERDDLDAAVRLVNLLGGRVER